MTTTARYTLSLHDALPICGHPLECGEHRRFGSFFRAGQRERHPPREPQRAEGRGRKRGTQSRSEEHTSELQSLRHLVCRLLLEKKKKTSINKKATTKTIRT